MLTRAQKNAWNEATANHRRLAAFAADIAASSRQHTAQSTSPSSAASNAPPAASSNAVEPTEVSFITPEKCTRKRKLPAVSPTVKKQHAQTKDGASGISAATRGASSSPTKTRAERMIRRTLNYTTASEDHEANKTPASPVKQLKATPAPVAVKTPAPAVESAKTAVGASPLSVLKRVANSSKSGNVIVGRADERQQIDTVFSQASPARALFVIGPPGTGKSSCVASVALGHATTSVIRVNCSTFTSPAKLLEGIDEQLRGHLKSRLPSLEDAQELEEFLQSSVLRHATSSQCVFVLDEVDHLVRLPHALQAKVQTLLRFFVRWAHLPNATLRFIGILNGVDMHAQIAEFLAHDPNPTSVVLFPSYSHEELVDILANHIRSANPGLDKKITSEAIEPRAMELIARKIAARDGDARRAVSLLQQCARACIAAAEEKSQPGPARMAIRDVLQLTSAAIVSQVTVVKQIQQLPRNPKLLLYAITRLAPSEKTTISLDDVCEELQDLQAQRELAWIPRFRQEEMQQHLGSLECYALVKQTPGKSKWKPRLTSTVDMETLRRAFQDDELLKELPMP